MKNISSIFIKFRVGIFSGLFLAAVLVFTCCATSHAEKPASKSTPPVHSETITLRAGDILEVSFPGSANLDTAQQIRRDGKIVLPLVGEVMAAGLSPDALQQNLVKLYATQLSSKEVVVALKSSSFPVFVTGAVIHPGKILSDHPITALEAVMEAGGPDYTTANLKAVKIIRNENGAMENFKLNLKAVLAGDNSQPFYLKPEDIIYVPERFQMF